MSNTNVAGPASASTSSAAPPPDSIGPHAPRQLEESARASARRARLTVSKVNPWSVLKLSFLLSVAAGIVGVALTVVIWSALSSMGVFTGAGRAINQVVGKSTTFSVMDYVGLGRVIPLAIVIAVADIVLITAASTVAAVLYNIASALVSGLQVTFTDE